MRRKLAFGRLANYRRGGRRSPRLPYPSRETPEGSTPQRVCAGTDSEVSPHQHGTLAPILPLLWRKPRRREASFPEVTELGSKPRRLCPGVYVLTSVRFTQSWEKVSLLSVFYFTFSRGVYGFWNGNVSL